MSKPNIYPENMKGSQTEGDGSIWLFDIQDSSKYQNENMVSIESEKVIRA